MNGVPGTLVNASRRHLTGRYGRTRWIALGAAISLLVGAFGSGALALVTSGDKPVFVDVTPQRIADTRFDIGITNALSSGTPKLLQVTGSVPIAPSGTAVVVPDGASAVALNVTAVNPSRAGFVSVRPGNPGAAPTTSNLNVVAGVTVPNAVTVGLPIGGGNDGKIQIWFQASGPGTTDILVDVVGYYDNHNHDDRYYTKAQVRNIVFDHAPIVGWIDSDGSKLDGGAYTSSRSSAGVYAAFFNVTGIGIKDVQMPPNVVASPSTFCANGTFLEAEWAGYGTFGSDVTYFSIQVNTFNAALAPTDCSFHFHINFDAPATLVLSPEGLPAADDPSAAFPAGTRVDCRNAETGPVCAPAD